MTSTAASPLSRSHDGGADRRPARSAPLLRGLRPAANGGSAADAPASGPEAPVARSATPLVPLAQLEAGTRVQRVLLVRAATRKVARNGKAYLDLELGDRTGAIAAKRWDVDPEALAVLRPGAIVRVQARVDAWKGVAQLQIDRFERVDPDRVDLTALLPSTPFDIEEMWTELRTLHATIEHPALRQLLSAFLDDPAFARDFRRAPAATHHHHPYVGGLLEHVLSLSRAADRLCAAYPALDRDLLLTGVFLHDIGKIAAYEVEAGFGYTDHGRLTGHITTGVLWLEERARTIADFPPALLEHLRHLVLSHHGKPEWGSPVEPMTPEAIALHALDNLDAKLWSCLEATHRAREQGSHWSEYVRALGTRVYAGPTGGLAEFRSEDLDAPR
ncbi:MAG: HD domain-containing protein [Planctomycetota bacterium]|nr:MAG: HD domain-containing protein [Planctomycetota bacterium]